MTLVTDDGGSATSDGDLGTGRLEAFSDGVFAIAITLLVLEIGVRPGGNAVERIVREWPSYLAFVVSFLTIGAVWIGHAATTDRLARADALLLRLNLLLLLFVTFMPFPTHLVAEAIHDRNSERVFVTFYGMTLLAMRVFLWVLDSYATRQHLYQARAQDEELVMERRKLLPVIIGYIVGMLVGVVLPTLAFAFYFGVAIYLVVPFRDVAQLLFGRD
jgi:TMEM175 potassium channel family protein